MSPQNAKTLAIRPLVAVAALIALDQITKELVLFRFALYESYTVIPGFFDLTHIKNRGAAFGFMAHVESIWISVFFGVIALVAAGVLTRFYKASDPTDRLSRVSYILIGSGALGNLIDRFRFGAVTDFLLFYIGDHQWPAFNVADSCITIGVALLVWRIITERNAPASPSS